MELSIYSVTYKDLKELSKEIEFSVACERVREAELVLFKLTNTDSLVKFKNSAMKILRSMKKDGIIKLFLFADELNDAEKMESVYLLNKFPSLKDLSPDENTVLLKL